MIRLNKEQAKAILDSNKGKSYTYGLCRENGSLFYVGVGTDNRLFVHEAKVNSRYDKNKLKKNIIKKEKCILYVIFKFDSRVSCLELESALISRMGKILDGGLLANLTDGGEGIVGYSHSDENKKKIAAASRKCWENPEYREIQSNSSKDRWQDKDYRRKIEDAREKYLTEDHRASVSAKSKKMWECPEYRKKMALITEKLWSDPEYKARTLEKMRQGRLAKGSEEKRLANLKESVNTEKEKNRRSQLMKELWSNPETREKLLKRSVTKEAVQPETNT